MYIHLRGVGEFKGPYRIFTKGRGFKGHYGISTKKKFKYLKLRGGGYGVLAGKNTT